MFEPAGIFLIGWFLTHVCIAWAMVMESRNAVWQHPDYHQVYTPDHSGVKKTQEVYKLLAKLQELKMKKTQNKLGEKADEKITKKEYSCLFTLMGKYKVKYNGTTGESKGFCYQAVMEELRQCNLGVCRDGAPTQFLNFYFSKDAHCEISLFPDYFHVPLKPAHKEGNKDLVQWLQNFPYDLYCSPVPRVQLFRWIISWWLVVKLMRLIRNLLQKQFLPAGKCGYDVIAFCYENQWAYSDTETQHGLCVELRSGLSYPHIKVHKHCAPGTCKILMYLKKDSERVVTSRELHAVLSGHSVANPKPHHFRIFQKKDGSLFSSTRWSLKQLYCQEIFLNENQLCQVHCDGVLSYYINLNGSLYKYLDVLDKVSFGNSITTRLSLAAVIATVLDVKVSFEQNVMTVHAGSTKRMIVARFLEKFREQHQLDKLPFYYSVKVNKGRHFTETVEKLLDVWKKVYPKTKLEVDPDYKEERCKALEERVLKMKEEKLGWEIKNAEYCKELSHAIKVLHSKDWHNRMVKHLKKIAAIPPVKERIKLRGKIYFKERNLNLFEKIQFAKENPYKVPVPNREYVYSYSIPILRPNAAPSKIDQLNREVERVETKIQNLSSLDRWDISTDYEHRKLRNGRKIMRKSNLPRKGKPKHKRRQSIHVGIRNEVLTRGKCVDDPLVERTSVCFADALLHLRSTIHPGRGHRITFGTSKRSVPLAKNSRHSYWAKH